MIVLNLKSQKGNPRNSEGSFITLNDGRIMYTYTKFNGYSWHDTAQADIVARYSLDGGETWSVKDKLIRKNSCSQNIMSVSLLRLRSGKIALFFMRKESDSDCRPAVCFSSDEGESWSKAVNCIDEPGYHVLNNDRIIQLECGKLLMPLAVHAIGNDGKLMEFKTKIVFYKSEDEALTWKRTENEMAYPRVKDDDVLQEPGVIELKDGTIWAWARTNMGSQYVSYSKDDGETWTFATPSVFISPLSPMSVKRNPETGELVAVWNDISSRWTYPEADKEKAWGRTPLVMAKSYDEGKTWENYTLLENDPAHGYCYIAIHFSSKGIILAYCCGGVNTVSLQDSCIRLIKNQPDTFCK